MPWIDINRVKPDPAQPRKVFSGEHIEGLAASIKQEGFINEIEVTPTEDGFMVITGECRLKAAHLLNFDKVPVRVNSTHYSEYERLRHQMAENVHQSGSSYDAMMNPIDTAKGYARLISLKIGKDYQPGELSLDETYGLIKPIAQEIGVEYETIWEYLKLLEQPSFAQEDITEGRPRTYYREADSAPLEVQEELKKKIASGDYKSRSEIEQDVMILKRFPDLTQVSLERKRAKESISSNRILNGVAKLGLALEDKPLSDIDVMERGIITAQLEWIIEKITVYLGTTNENII